MRVCILGNSHTASLKLGWDAIRDQWPAVDITFFASRAQGLAGLEFRDGVRLVPNNPDLARDIAYTSGGHDNVDLRSYEVFLVYGTWLMLPPQDPRLSCAVRRAALEDVIEASLNFRICSMLLRCPGTLVYSGHDPQPASEGEAPCACSYAEILAEAAKVASEWGVRLVGQPASTLGNGWNTAYALSRGSRRLDLGDSISNELHVDWDVIHMNGTFGRAYLEDFLSGLGLSPDSDAAGKGQA